MISSALLLVLLARPVAGDAIRSVRPMPNGRAFHGSCVLGNHLYVIGGGSYSGADYTQIVNENELETWYAPILAGGNLGEWKLTTALPAPRHYLSNATVVLNDVVYLVGGTDGIEDGKRHTTILMNRPNADGSLGAWVETSTFPNTGLSFTSAFSTPGWLHMVAGVTSERELSPKTWSVAVNPDGNLGEWREGPSLPAGIWFHQAGVAGGRVHVYGGLETYPNAEVITAAVHSAPLLGDGRIGSWMAGKPLPQGFYGGVPASMGPYLMSFLGRYKSGSAGENSDVWWTVAGPPGLGDWTKLQSSVAVRRYHAVATDYRNSSFYVVGGKVNIDSGGYPLVYVFSLTPEARAFAERGWSTDPIAAGGASAASATETTATDSLATGEAPATPVASRRVAGLPEFFLPYQLATPYDDAGNTRPMVMYFMAPGAKPTLEQNDLLAEASVRDASKRAVFATVDVAATPQVAQQRGVFRVPTWLFFDSRGQLLDRKTGKLSAQELADRVAALR